MNILLSSVCWIRRHLPRSREQRELLGHVLDSFDMHNERPLDPKRECLYRGLTWSMGMVSLERLGVWDEAQGMPHEWCAGSVPETANCYGEAKEHDGAYHERIQYWLGRPMHAIIAMDGHLRRGREKCARTDWSIDDGCMRAVAFALRGKRRILCYLGSVL